MTTVNWGELLEVAAQGGSFEPLPDGSYEVVIKEAEHKITSGGKLMFVVKFQVIAGPHTNRLVWNNFVISPESPNAMSFFFQHMSVFGLVRDFFASQPTPDVVVQHLLNKPAPSRSAVAPGRARSATR